MAQWETGVPRGSPPHQESRLGAPQARRVEETLGLPWEGRLPAQPSRSPWPRPAPPLPSGNALAHPMAMSGPYALPLNFHSSRTLPDLPSYLLPLPPPGGKGMEPVFIRPPLNAKYVSIFTPVSIIS